MIRPVALALASLLVLQPAPPTWRLVEEWRVGGEPSGPHALHDVRDLELLPNGNIVLLEFKDQQIHFLDGRGKPVRTVGRSGGGPGEYQNANGFVVFPNGNLLVNDPNAHRFTLLNSKGDFLKAVPMGQTRSFGWLWDAWVDAQGRLVEIDYVRRGEKFMAARERWSADLTKSETLLPAECPPVPGPPAEARSYSFRNANGGMSMSIPYVGPTMPALFTVDGAQWGASWPTFSPIRRLPAGTCTPDVTIPLAGAPVAIPTVVRDSAVKRVVEAASKYSSTPPDLSRIPRVFPAFDVMRLDQLGQLWVSRWTDATRKRFEVYGKGGVPVATLDAPPSLVMVRPTIITADRFIAIVTDEDDVPYLVSYRIVK
ncbi:MAG: hypothetical protein IPP98_05405 [Gemmatimonadetes bacterium]|nr:hypothetical protein [Gemmatimonadota bacterium]